MTWYQRAIAYLLRLPWYVWAGGAGVGTVALMSAWKPPSNNPHASGDGGKPVSNPGGVTPDNVRDLALNLLTAYLPCTTGDAKFSEIAKDFGGVGTTCGYLPAWLMWRLGCVDPRIVNRSEPAEGLHYAVGMNIARLVQGGKDLGAWRTPAQNGRPKLGDLCYYAMDPPQQKGDGTKDYHEHVNVCIDSSGDDWKSADAGRTNPKDGKQMAEFVTRKRLADGRIDYYGGPRKLIGWVDLAALPFTRPPNLA